MDSIFFNNPEQETMQTDSRIKRRAYIEEMQNIYVLLFWR